MSNMSNVLGVAPTSSDDNSPTPITSKKIDDINNVKGLGIVVYKECLKNHAASLGGNAKDGCGEFMPTNDDNLDCSVCGCHRNFHRREVDVGGGGWGCLPHYPYYLSPNSSTPISHQEVLLNIRCGPHDLARLNVKPAVIFPKVEKMEGNGEGGNLEIIEGVDINSKKRHRTRFTSEQKEKMLEFANKAEWKIQKLDERLVQEFCQEMGIKRRVFKVWMHNNKQHYVMKDSATNSSSNDLVSVPEINV